ncbi:MAG: glycine--tRNA ligase subunit beta, partial [Actinobacteria bacterium]|nr:glycine--tRNA ligase subunit beta [Actinomycetota bacterium]
MELDFLLEIGTEEIPASMVDLGMDQLKNLAKDLIKENRLTFTGLKTMGTPRRLVLLIENLSERQEESIEEIKGPAAKSAFDEKSNPTQAASGFARSQKADVSDLIVRDTPQGSYVFVIKRHKGETTQEVLPEILKRLVLSLSFPKTMRWGDSELRFVRPIHWLAALCGEEIIKFSLDGIESSNLSWGHRFLAESPVKIKSSKDYFKTIRDAKVIVDYEERRNLILDQINQIAKENNAKVVLNEKTFNEVVNLVEYPHSVCGSFSDEFLSLPREVLVTAMESHQRYFPVEDNEGNLKANFIVVHNGDENCRSIITSGHERVLRARLSDARFFYQEDQKEPFAGKTEKLKNVVFQERLGSIFDKVKRVEKIAGLIADNIGLDETEKKNVLKAAFLCKTDLITNMVIEFPVLQGVMGREYAKLSGEKEEVAKAIYEHYLPKSASDDLPESRIGRVVSIADKIDTIAGCFCIGFIPSGSEDPYSLRRQMYGIVEIIIRN